MTAKKIEIKLRMFDPRRVTPNKNCIFIGKKQTGKSTLLANILYHNRKIPFGIAMSGTEDGNKFYQSYIPDTFIYSEFVEEVVEKLIRRQKKCVSQGIPNSESFLLLDDLMFDSKSFVNKKCIRQIFMNGRHWKLLLLLTSQYVMSLPPDLRSQIDFIFVFKENIQRNRRRLWENFFGVFPTYDEFEKALFECTENYECLVLDNACTSNKIEDQVFWYKAPFPTPKFRVGSKELWNYHNKTYNKHYDDDSDIERGDSVFTKNTKPIIHICKTKKKKRVNVDTSKKEIGKTLKTRDKEEKVKKKTLNR